MSDEPASFASTLKRLAADDETEHPRAPRINGDALLTLNERAAGTATAPTGLPAAAYDAWSEPHARPVGSQDFREADAALAATTGLVPLRALRRRWAARLHPDLVAAIHKTAAEDLMRRINSAIDAARSREADR